MKIGIFQGTADLGNREANVSKILQILEECSANQCCLVVFPEVWITGYGLTKEQYLHLAIRTDHELIQKIRESAKRHRVAICFGYPELNEKGDAVYNSAIFMDQKGDIIINHRKSHLWGEKEKATYEGSGKLSEPEVITFEFGSDGDQKTETWKVSLLICYEIEFPEPARVMKLKGSDLILVPTANTSSFTHTITVPARSFENMCYIAYVNYAEKDSNELPFCGLSCLCTPFGTSPILFENKQEGVVFTTITQKCKEIDQINQWNPYFKDRLPHMYKSLCE